MKYIVTLNGKQYEVEVEKGKATAVLTGNAPAAAPAATPAAAPTAPAAAPVSSGSESIPSPMPGTILSVKCAVGQAVKKGDVLFILEAMKMENEIFSPCDGVVNKICVSQGDQLNADDELMVIG